jgi:RNA-directed DNA polymerase
VSRSSQAGSRLASLQAITNRAQLATLLGFKPASLAYILFKLPPSAKYTTFTIAKRNGGVRIIQAPVPSLKLLQRKLSDLLLDCVDEINAATGRKDRAAHGFKRGRSIRTNAVKHRHRRWAFNIDLENFFPTIHFGRVRGFFISNKDFSLHQDVATAIAQIACDGNALPQGSPCSPVISNLIAGILDVRLVALASAAGCTYSRYADDLTFSTNKPTFPSEIAIPVPSLGVHTWEPAGPLQTLIQRAGFTINAAKTRMMYRNSRQDVTGLVVNRKVNVRSEYRRTVRAMVHRLLRTGKYEAITAVANAGSVVPQQVPGSLRQLHGLLGFIDWVDREADPDRLRDRPDLAKKEKSYRQFLLFTNFWIAPRPVIVCEGDTDNVYLTTAITQLAAQYPELADISNSGKVTLKVRLFKYRKTSTRRLIGLKDGGYGGLMDLIRTYLTEHRAFKAAGKLQPAILLVDDDDGGKKVKSMACNIAGQKAMGAYLRVFANLYLMATPLPPGAKASTIEDFFDAAAKAIPYHGKTFHEDGPGFDPTKHIGKQIFAHKVVRTNATKIDFSGFKPLLDTLITIVQTHRASVAQPTSERPNDRAPER